MAANAAAAAPAAGARGRGRRPEEEPPTPRRLAQRRRRRTSEEWAPVLVSGGEGRAGAAAGRRGSGACTYPADEAQKPAPSLSPGRMAAPELARVAVARGHAPSPQTRPKSGLVQPPGPLTSDGGIPVFGCLPHFAWITVLCHTLRTCFTCTKQGKACSGCPAGRASHLSRQGRGARAPPLGNDEVEGPARVVLTLAGVEGHRPPARTRGDQGRARLLPEIEKIEERSPSSNLTGPRDVPVLLDVDAGEGRARSSSTSTARVHGHVRARERSSSGAHELGRDGVGRVRARVRGHAPSPGCVRARSRVRAHAHGRVRARTRTISDAVELTSTGAFELGSARARSRTSSETTILDATELTSTGAFELGSIRARRRMSSDATISERPSSRPRTRSRAGACERRRARAGTRTSSRSRARSGLETCDLWRG